MFARLFGTLTLLAVSGSALAVDPWWTPDNERCYQDPNTKSSYKCYNTKWTEVTNLQSQVQGALNLALNEASQYSERAFEKSTTNPQVHCSQDMLGNNVQAANRLLWTIRCRFIPYDLLAKNLFTINPLTMIVDVAPIVQYPVFGTDLDKLYGALPRSIDYREYACGNLPGGYKFVGSCDAGCFQGAQSLGEGSMESQADRVIDVDAWAEGGREDVATTRKVKAKVKRLPIAGDEGHDIYDVWVEHRSEPSLHVTPEHPLIGGDGKLVSITDLKEGDSLLTVDGEAAITRIEKSLEKKAVYNIEPESLAPEDNIVVVGDGFLVGSLRVQRAEVVIGNRLLKRQTLAID